MTTANIKFNALDDNDSGITFQEKVKLSDNLRKLTGGFDSCSDRALEGGTEREDRK